MPKQSRPPKVSRSVRIRPWLLDQVDALCVEEQLTFNEVVERALELYVKRG